MLQALKGIPREAYYIATKVGRYELNYDDMFNFTVEKTRKSIKKSLELLGVDYVDVIQVKDRVPSFCYAKIHTLSNIIKVTNLLHRFTILNLHLRWT